MFVMDASQRYGNERASGKVRTPESWRKAKQPPLG
jgi:hypothetical protein